MSIRNFDAIFQPRTIALIGASDRAHSVGAVIAANLSRGAFSGSLMMVNPKHDRIAGLPCYPDVARLPITPELAVICTPAATIPGLITALGARGTKGAIVVSAGFNELGSNEGRALQQAMLDAARPHLLRIIGPNGVGVLSTPAGINASFAHLQPLKGNIAFVAQSGAMLTTVLDWACARRIGFSHLVSLGDMADVDFGDMLDYLANDKATHAILLYVEAITQARKFMSAARAAARTKPVVVIKAGRHAAAAKAALSHTGALAGSDAVYDAAFRRAGFLRVRTLDELFDAVETLATARLPSGDRLAILTNGGGLGVLATDALLDRGGELAELSHETNAKLNSVLPPTWSHANPVDIIGDAPPERYDTALRVLLSSTDLDAILVLNCPVAVASSTDAARAVVRLAKTADKPVLTSWVGDTSAAEARAAFLQHRIPTYETPDKAMDGFAYLTRYRRAQQQLLEVPAASAPDFRADSVPARRVVAGALAAGTERLDAIEINAILSSYGISSARTEFATTEDEAGRCAARIGGDVVLKIQSPDIAHKSDIGGVILGLKGADRVEQAAREMRARVMAAAPNVRIKGFLIQEMIERANAYELIVGITVDPLFGPVILFGRGGTGVEVIKDTALGLAPLNLPLAREMIEQTHVYRQLRGYRDRKPVDLDAIALTLVKLSQLACDLDEIREFEINPLLVDEHGIVAVDARARVAALPTGAKRGLRLSIRPYPHELESRETLAGLGQASLRPIRPEDATGLDAFFHELSQEDVRLRFFSQIHEMPPAQRARLTQIDYDREMAFVLVLGGSIIGVARLAADPDNLKGEFAVVVRSDLKGRGIGWMLMSRILDYARTRGTATVFGEILPDNAVMIQMCRELGFRLVQSSDTGLVHATLAVDQFAAAAR